MRGAGLLALAGALFLAYRSDRALFGFAAEKTPRYFDKVGHALAKHHGLRFLLTFDEARPVEWIGHAAVQCPGTERVPARLGEGRRFDGRPDTYVQTSAWWPDLGPTYTLAIRVELEDAGLDQEIWYTSIQGRRTGFKLREGRMTFFVPGGSQEQAASYPFEAYGRSVHLAGVVEGPGGQAHLYENGKRMASIPVEAVAHPDHNVEFGKMRWYAVAAPLRGAIDEAAAWTRALSPKDVRARAKARRSMPRDLAPGPYYRWRFMQGLQRGIPAALKLLDRFNVLLHEGRLAEADLPDVQLHLSSGDSRHFIQTHERSLASGRRVARGANPRRIHAQYGGQTVEARLWLDGSDLAYPASRRPSYVLETPADHPAFGAHWLRLTPPESMADGLPDVGTVRDGGLCRLAVNGQLKGVYRYASFDRHGLEPGERPEVADGPDSPIDWRRLFRPAAARKPSSLPPDERAARLERLRQLLVDDIYHPWSSREWDWRIRTTLAQMPAPDAPTRSPFDVLGRNPSPHYIIEDLDLSALRDVPASAVWSSSRPDLIGADGKVTRPDGDLPVDVELTANMGPGAVAETLTLAFRVMPRRPRLPALMLYVDEPLANTKRVDFMAYLHPAGGEDPPRLLRGGQASRGGIKHRGNTSYWRGKKKPFSLQFEEPHHLVGDTDTCHLYLLNGYTDTTKLRNKLAYDLFRSFAAEGHPRFAPEIGWTEVFVNGVYYGIYETCTRVHGQALGVKDAPEDPEASAVLYKMRAPASLFAESRTDAFDQVLPPADRIQRIDPLLDLMAFTAQTDSETFARDVERRVDLDNAIDFLLLLNFTGNVDGRTTNFYLGRFAGPEARFFFIPWDYDHTFEDNFTWLTNHLFDRLRREMPGFDERVRARWRELRTGPLAETALDERISGMAARLDGYMDWEFARLDRAVPPTYLDIVEEFRQAVRAKLGWMDSRLGAIPPPEEGEK